MHYSFSEIGKLYDSGHNTASFELWQYQLILQCPSSHANKRVIFNDIRAGKQNNTQGLRFVGQMHCTEWLLRIKTHMWDALSLILLGVYHSQVITCNLKTPFSLVYTIIMIHTASR